MAVVTLVTLVYYTCTVNNEAEEEGSRMSRCLSVQQVSLDLLYHQDNLHWVIRIVWVIYSGSYFHSAGRAGILDYCV